MKHDFYTSQDISEHDEWGQRNIVDGGLSLCKVCGELEGGLPTECPGERISYERGQDIYRGKIDFINGDWVKIASKNSPEFWRVKGNFINDQNQ